MIVTLLTKKFHVRNLHLKEDVHYVETVVITNMYVRELKMNLVNILYQKIT